VDEVLVEGDEAYRDAKDFMKMLMPSHARNVKPYKDTRPLFSRYQVETQLDSLFSQTVTLPSGGYMVINQTEALVSIDINSGRSTREHNIEDTALRTNLEASDEIARQLRLRDLAGLIVIDFIDMEEKRNNRAVERRLKEALKHDRARIQVGRISHFGLLEMSRQRLRQGMLEGSTKTCPHCEGRGIIRSVSSSALSVLRSIEEQLIAKRPENLTVQCNREVASYILNEKRDHLLTLEQSFAVSIYIVPSDDVKAAEALIERGGERTPPVRKALSAPVKMETALAEVPEEEPVEDEEEPVSEQSTSEEQPIAASEGETSEGEQKRGHRRRRRGRRGGRRNREEHAQPGGRDFEPREHGGNGAAAQAEAQEAAAIEPGFNGSGIERTRPSDAESEQQERREMREEPPGEDAAEARSYSDTGGPSVEGSSEEPSESPASPESSDEPAQRRWSPPEPTVDRSAKVRKAGWWQRRGEG
jgi:ribonuclease E